MKAWLTYSPILIVIVFIFLIIRWIKYYKEFRQATNSGRFSLNYLFFTPDLSMHTEKEVLAFKKLKKAASKNMIIWAAALIIYISATVIIGILTAKK